MSKTDMIRLAFFFGILALIALWEVAVPRRGRGYPKALRWASNLGIVAIYLLTIRIIFPVLPAGVADAAYGGGYGFFGYTGMPYWPSVVIGFVALDFVIYLQHVMFHAVPFLWRFHMMHHADLDFDVTTGLRFHPVEIIISTIIKITVVAALGPPLLAVVVFEVLLNGTSMFNHGNVYMPLGIDRIARLFVVTPDMHRVHHSVTIRETNSNFGFNLPWWDRLLGTYRAQPAKGHMGMTIGLSHIREAKRCLNLGGMLALPFTGETGSYPIGRAAREPQA
jgi:sterol desaturase/sphingolipid hydroxylase (fatty acid hydroxylase superfamily)